MLFSFNSFSQNNLQESNKNYKSTDGVEELLEKAKKTENLDSIVFYTQLAIKGLQKNTNKFLKFTVYYKLSYAFFRKQDYKNANLTLDSCIQIGLKNNFRKQLVDAYQLKGTIAHYEGLYDKAIEAYKIALENADDIDGKISLNTNLSAIYNETGNFELALVYIHEFIAYNKQYPKLINKHMITYNYLNLSIAASTYKEKLAASDSAIATATLTKDKELFFIALDNKAQVLMEEQHYNDAVAMYKKVIWYAKENNNSEILKNTFLNLSEVSFKQKNYSLSLSYLDSLKFLTNNKNASSLVNLRIDTLLFHNYLKTVNYKEASVYGLKYIDYLKKEKQNIQNTTYLEYGKKYQTDQKIQENELLQKDNEIKDLEVKKQTTSRNYFIALATLVLISLGFTYNRFRLKRKTANALASQNTIINNQKVALEKSNANKQKLFGIIAHDLVNPFNAILGYTKLLEEDYDDFSEQERKQFISIINKYANSNYNLTRTLLDWAKVQQNQLVVEKATLNCKTIVNEAILAYQVLADKKEIQINTNIPDNTFIEADKNMMQTVIGNLFVNAIKFTSQKGEINFYLHKNVNGTVEIEIEDNGIGMSQEQLNTIFDITKVSSSLGTNKEKGNGLGLILCKELMELQKGTLQMFSQKDKGSKIVVTI